MKFFINEKVLVQIELDLDHEGQPMYRLITFFRCTHKVHETRWYHSYKDIMILFKEMIKVEYEM